MHNTIPDPSGLSWLQWANTVTGFNPHFGQYVSPDMAWQDYARSLTYLEPLAPRADWFASWQEWAIALKQAISS